MPVKAVLFDMDGLLLNTEDLYTEATNEVLAKFGKGPLPWEVKINLQGRPGPDAAKHLLDWAKLPYTPQEFIDASKEVQVKLWPRTKFLPGALELLQYLHSNQIPFALATSSNTPNFHLKTAHLRHGFDLFGRHVVTGDDERIPAGRGKPHPDIWLVALESLNSDRRAAGLDDIHPSETLVFEDGVPGVAAGRAAGSRVVWVPDQRALDVMDKATIESVIGDNEIIQSLLHFDKSKYGL